MTLRTDTNPFNTEETPNTHSCGSEATVRLATKDVVDEVDNGGVV